MSTAAPAASRSLRRLRALDRVRRRPGAAAAHLPQQPRAQHADADGLSRHHLPQLQHPARPGRHAELRPCRLRRPRLVHRRPRDERRGQRTGAAAAGDGSAGRRARRDVLRGAVRLRHHQEVGHHLRHDHARHRRAGGGDVADVPGLLRRRGRRHHQPGLRQAIPRPHLRAADPGLLPGRGLLLHLDGADVRADQDAARAGCSTPCATTPSGSSSSATARSGCATSASSSPASSPASAAPWRPSTSRSSTPPTRSARCAPAATCCSPSSAAPPSSSGR